MKKLLLFAALCAASVVRAQEPTVVGRVTCKGRPVAGAVVSDGDLVTRTDADGRYAMVSQKPCGYVFLSIPRGYEAATDGLIPRHFGYTTRCAVDTIDFELERADNDDFTLFVSADTHLRGDPEELDLPQYRKWYLPQIRREIERTPGRVYSIHLGDMTTDIMWHRNDFSFRKYLDAMKTYPSPIFHVPGNHDNERFVGMEVPDAQWDSLAQAPYRQWIGPNYYSFNLGKVHFVMLDNIIVRRSVVKNGKSSSRNDYKLDERQLRWLTRDLETVDAATPLVVCMHVPIFRYTGIREDGTGEFATAPALTAMHDQIMPLLARFDRVRFLTGHCHVFINVPVNERITQHAFVSASAVSWKISGPESRLISEDGTPGGYGVIRVRGERMDMQFHPNGYEADRNQFRVYDLNRVPEAYGGEPNANRVLVNVYNWDEGWKISVRENGREIGARRTWTRDPLYRLIRRDALPTRPTAFLAVYNAHMFVVETSAPDTPLDIVVTDPAGRRYRQRVERPKAFDWRIE